MDLNGNLMTNSSPQCMYNDTVDANMYPTAYSLFFIFGLPANCLSLCVAWVLMRRGNSLAVYLVNLSMSDLLYTFTLPIWIMLAKRQMVNDTLCSIISVVMFNSFYVGSGLLCCISMDRYLAVVFPLYFVRAHEVKTAVWVCVLVWLSEITLHLILLAYTGELYKFSSSRMCEVTIPMHAKQGHMAIIRAVLGFFIPLLLMSFCFQQIMQSISRSSSIEASERQKIGLLLFILHLVYMLSFTPFQVVMFLRGLLEPKNCSFACHMRDYYMVFVATTTINSVLDPVFYCLISESAKVEIKRVYKKCESQVSNFVSIMRTLPSSTA